MRLDDGIRIKGAKGLCGRLGLGPPQIVHAVERLAVEVRLLDPVAIHQCDGADPGTGEIVQDRHAKPSRADDQDPGRAQPVLTGGADLRQRDLAGIAGHAHTLSQSRMRVSGSE